MNLQNITIQHAPNGYVVIEQAREYQVSNILAVFNRMADLTAWLSANFQLQVPADDTEGGEV